jgi:short-subunit dehydrogenase involved in D-alanine esterification of teichoic acids
LDALSHRWNIKAAIHSYTVSLRAVLKDKIEVIKLVPPAVQTDFTPKTNERFMRTFHVEDWSRAARQLSGRE